MPMLRGPQIRAAPFQGLSTAMGREGSSSHEQAHTNATGRSLGALIVQSPLLRAAVPSWSRRARTYSICVSTCVRLHPLPDARKRGTCRPYAVCSPIGSATTKPSIPVPAIKNKRVDVKRARLCHCDEPASRAQATLTDGTANGVVAHEHITIGRSLTLLFENRQLSGAVTGHSS